MVEFTVKSIEIGWYGLFQVDRKQQLIIIVIAAVILFTAGYRVARWYQGQNLEPARVATPINYQVDREIVVHVSGEVEKPGVYRFNSEMRVQDALEKAVPMARADVQSLNLAAILKDGQKIVVPVKQEAAQGVAAADPQRPAVPNEPAKININRAGAGELESLPGVGPAMARRIISYRENKGLFSSEEELKNVPGIGDKMYQQIGDYITVK